KLDRILDRDIHPPDLLKKELAGAGSALVAGAHPRYLSPPVHLVHQERLASGRDDRVVWYVAAVHVSIGVLGSLGFGDDRQVHEPAELSAGDADTGARGVGRGEILCERSLGIAFVRFGPYA